MAAGLHPDVQFAVMYQKHAVSIWIYYPGGSRYVAGIAIPLETAWCLRDELNEAGLGSLFIRITMEVLLQGFDMGRVLHVTIPPISKGQGNKTLKMNGK